MLGRVTCSTCGEAVPFYYISNGVCYECATPTPPPLPDPEALQNYRKSIQYKDLLVLPAGMAKHCGPTEQSTPPTSFTTDTKTAIASEKQAFEDDSAPQDETFRPTDWDSRSLLLKWLCEERASWIAARMPTLKHRQAIARWRADRERASKCIYPYRLSFWLNRTPSAAETRRFTRELLNMERNREVRLIRGRKRITHIQLLGYLPTVSAA